MDIDMSALRMLESEKGISVELVVDAIETALLSAYHKTAGAQQQARVELDRKTGHVTVWARRRPPRTTSRRRRRSPRSSTTRPRTSVASPRRSPAS
jgi:hypothetical protein